MWEKQCVLESLSDLKARTSEENQAVTDGEW